MGEDRRWSLREEPRELTLGKVWGPASGLGDVEETGPAGVAGSF